MNEGHQPLPDRDDQQDCVERYEAMLHRNDRYFFDVEEFELIIEHYLERNDLRQAKQVLDYANQQHPGSLDLLFCEAHLMMNMGKLTRALSVLDTIGRMEPLNEDVYLHKAGIYSQLRNYRKAIDHYKRALELAEEGLDDILLDLAFEYENLEQYDQSIDCLKRALAENPENEAVLFELAYCYDLASAHQAAVVFFRSFTNDHPYSFVAWFNLGNSLAQLDRLEESNEALDYCLAIEERFSSASFSKARNQLIMGDHQGAIDTYQETIEHDGPQAITFSYIGECYEKMERYEQALIHYDQAIALDPNWVDSWIGRGVVKDVQGRSMEAVRDLEVATRLAPDLGDAWFFYANVLGRAERFDEALAAYTKLNTLEPESLDGWLDHSDLLLRLKGPYAAMKKLQEGELVHKLNSRYKYRMSSYLLQEGLLQQGLLELEEALMADHSGHEQLFDHYPEAAQLPQVMHLLDLYRK
jgi:tetratricopeptide (TPR) repeat protein